MVNMHIAGSGIKAGQWVECGAQKHCRLMTVHADKEQLVNASMHLGSKDKNLVVPSDIAVVNKILKMNFVGLKELPPMSSQLNKILYDAGEGYSWSSDKMEMINDFTVAREQVKKENAALMLAQGATPSLVSTYMTLSGPEIAVAGYARKLHAKIEASTIQDMKKVKDLNAKVSSDVWKTDVYNIIISKKIWDQFKEKAKQHGLNFVSGKQSSYDVKHIKLSDFQFEGDKNSLAEILPIFLVGKNVIKQSDSDHPAHGFVSGSVRSGLVFSPQNRIQENLVSYNYI